LTDSEVTIADLLAMSGVEDIDFDPPRSKEFSNVGFLATCSRRESIQSGPDASTRTPSGELRD
jgi:hypothetical protein